MASQAAAVADGESRVAVGAERGRLGGWRKQSPQLSVEEGGDSAGAGESSAFKAVPPWRTPTPQSWLSPFQAGCWPRILPPPGGCSPPVAQPAGPGVSEPGKKLCRGRRRAPEVCTRRSPAGHIPASGPQSRAPRERGVNQGCHAGRGKVDRLEAEGRAG